jgi:hypothetical protein
VLLTKAPSKPKDAPMPKHSTRETKKQERKKKIVEQRRRVEDMLYYNDDNDYLSDIRNL